MDDRRMYVAASVALFLDAVGFSMLAPMLSTLQRQVDAGDVLSSFIFASFSGGLLLGFVLGALLVRAIGARTVWVGSMLCHAAAAVAVATSSSAGIVTAARTTQGLTSGTLWIAIVGVALLSPPALRASRLARLVAIQMVGTLLGPSMGLIGDLTRPFLLYAATLVALAGVTAFVVRAVPELPHVGRLASLRQRWVLMAVLWIGLIAATEGMVHGSYSLLFGRDLPQERVALLYVALGLAAAASAGGLARVITPRRAERLVQVSALTAVAGMLLVASVTSQWLWLAAMLVLGAAFGGGESSALSILGRDPTTGTLTALVAYSQSWAVGFLVGPPAGTALAGVAGWSAPAALVLVGVVVLSLSFRLGDPDRAASRGRPPPP